MNIEAYFEHWGITENPFQAEEARDDPVFRRLIDDQSAHPDFQKIFGQLDQPSAAVVFGEKGSGKTALRLMIERKVRQHNKKSPNSQVWVVKYDDLNPILDRFSHNQRRLRRKEGLNAFRLEDHMDGILSRATTQLIDLLIGESPIDSITPRKARRKIRWMDRQKRVDLAELAILYDEPVSGNPETRWSKLRGLLRLGQINIPRLAKVTGLIMGLFAALLGWISHHYGYLGWQLGFALSLSAISSIVLLGAWVTRTLKLSKLVKLIRKEIVVTDRRPAQLHQMLGYLPPLIPGQPVPIPGDLDSRYQLLTRFINILEVIGCTGMIVLVDRMDEPTMIKGDSDKMKAVVWPMFDNKFLQLDRVGVKLLLPIELRHLLRKEDASFYQKARLDKQNMIDHLMWSGASLFDLCNRRLRVCGKGGDDTISLLAIFDDEVEEQDLIDALDQMHQPRDAFKFIYQIIQEHCRNMPDHAPQWKIPKLTLEFVRRQQSQRIQDLYRGLSPA